MDRLLSALALSALAVAPCLAAQSPFDATVDLRAVAADGEPSFLDGGLGELRFDDQHDGVRIGDIRLGYHDDFYQIVHVTLEAMSYGDDPHDPLDLTEALIEIRPFPLNGWRSRLKIGAFYAPISLESRLEGWRSGYSLSPSALNTWVGEELRTIGMEYDLDWLGRQRGHDWELGLAASAFGWNDSAGALLAQRGWAIHDRQTTLFGRVGTAGQTQSAVVPDVREFYGIDQRVGYYGAAEAKYRDALELRALHYDNRADPAAYAPRLQSYAWHTRFNSAGARWTPSEQWTLISQWLGGHTDSGEADDQYGWEFHAAFVLASYQTGANQLSARYDGFEMHQNAPALEPFYNADRGHAWTIAYTRQFGSHWSVLLEGLQIDSRLAARVFLDEPVAAVERELQLALRLDL